jgi:protein ImuA
MFARDAGGAGAVSTFPAFREKSTTVEHFLPLSYARRAPVAYTVQKHSTNMTSAAFGWEVEEPPRPPARTPRPVLPPGQLPAAVEAALWHGNELGSLVVSTCSSGWGALDAELPGAGWGCHSLTEVLTAQPSVLEWRLLTPALAPIAKAGQTVVIVGPPKHPHIPGLVQAGLDDRRLVWIDVETPAERLWVTEQLVRANAAGAILSWLPHARPEQIRRLQVASQACDGPVFLLRPENARNEASAAPLRVLARLDVDWALNVQILKRRGPVHDGQLSLPSVPLGLEAVLTPRLRKPSVLIAHREVPANVVGSTTPSVRRRRLASVS